MSTPLAPLTACQLPTRPSGNDRQCLSGRLPMRLQFVGTNSSGGGCPAVYKTDRGTVVVQGWKLEDSEAGRHPGLGRERDGSRDTDGVAALPSQPGVTPDVSSPAQTSTRCSRATNTRRGASKSGIRISGSPTSPNHSDASWLVSLTMANGFETGPTACADGLPRERRRSARTRGQPAAQRLRPVQSRRLSASEHSGRRGYPLPAPGNWPGTCHGMTSGCSSRRRL